MSEQLEQAYQLLASEPLPDNAETRLRALEQAAPDDEAEVFAQLWEGLNLQRDLDAEPPE